MGARRLYGSATSGSLPPRRISAKLVVTLAAFVALGVTAYAAVNVTSKPSAGAQASAVCPNGKTYTPDPVTVPQACNQVYRGKTNKGGKVELKVIYNPDTNTQSVSKFGLEAKARCSDGKRRRMLQGFRDQVRLGGEITNGHFEMKREQSDTSGIGVAVQGTVSLHRASGTGSWIITYAPFKGFKNGVPQYGAPITCRTGTHRWTARLVPDRKTH